MPKAATKIVEVEGIKIAVPVGSMDPPTAEAERIMKEHEDPRGWKYPVRPMATSSKRLAEDYAYCLDWYCGGHEVREDRAADCTLYIVTSKGYYFYVGA